MSCDGGEGTSESALRDESQQRGRGSGGGGGTCIDPTHIDPTCTDPRAALSNEVATSHPVSSLGTELNGAMRHRSVTPNAVTPLVEAVLTPHYYLDD